MDQTNSSKTFLGNKLGQRDVQFTVSVRKAEVRNCNESKNMKKNIDQYYKEHQQVLKDLEKEQTNLMNRWKLRRMSLVAVNNARQEEVIAAVESSNNDPATTATTTTTTATANETWNAKLADQKHNTTDTKSPLPNIEKNWRKLNLSRMTARSEPFSGPLPEVQATSPRRKQNNIFGKLFQNSPEKRKRFSDHGTDKWAKNEDAAGQKIKTEDVTDKKGSKDDASNNGSPREDSTGKWPKSLLPHLSRNLSLGYAGDNRLNTLPRSKLQQKRFSHSISYESGLDKSWGKSLNAKDGLLKAALLQANNAVNILPKSPLLSPRQSKLKRHSDVRADVIPEI